MGRVALQEYNLPSQHVFRSLRRKQARELRESEMLGLKMQLGQIKFEHALLLDEVMSWRSWYKENCCNFICDESVGEGAACDISIDTATSTAKVEANKCNLFAQEVSDLEEVTRGINVVLKELGAVSFSAQEESTYAESVGSRSLLESSILDEHGRSFTAKRQSLCRYF